MEESRNVVVIGGGIVGVCVARELQRDGHKVTLIEKGAIAQGCSYANAGWITPCFAMPLPQPGMLLKSLRWLLDPMSPLHIKPSLDPVLVRWLLLFMGAMTRKKMMKSIEALTALSKFSLEYYAEFASPRKDEVGFRKNGLLMVSGDDEGLEYARKEMDLMAGQGIEGRFMERDELLEFEPVLKPIVKGGVYFPNEAQIEPYTVSQFIAREFSDHGGTILANTEVFDFNVSPGGRVEEIITTHGKIRAPLVVLAGGSWTPTLARRLGLSIPLLGGKGYSMSVTSSSRRPSRPIMIVDRKIAVTPRADSVRLAGTLELVNQDFSISPSRLNAIHQGAHEYLKLDGEDEPRDIWRGLRPCTPDGVPLIGFSDEVSNLFYCTGHQMLGLQSAPGSARLAADLIGGRTPFTDPAPFNPGRYE